MPSHFCVPASAPLYLQSSVDSGQLQPFDARNGPAFRPLPFNLPLKSFKDVRLHASSYLLHTKQSLQVSGVTQGFSGALQLCVRGWQCADVCAWMATCTCVVHLCH